MKLDDLATPALVIDTAAFEHNLATMAAALPGARLRPHVKAHKTTAIARAQVGHGHRAFTCATAREVLVMAAAGLGDDLLLANETLDRTRLRAMAALADTALVTVAVDSDETIDAAAAAGIDHVLIDVNVGLPRCGCAPADAGRLADRARAAGLSVRGVMGYEGHLMGVAERAERADQLVGCVELLLVAHDLVGGEIVSAGGTGTYDLHDGRVTEIQAGSYVLMDTAYGKLGSPFRQALFLHTTVLSRSPRWAVCDGGLKSLGMDHGNPSIPAATVWFCSDEHITFSTDDPASLPRPGSRVRVVPAHVDPTMALHDRVHLVDGDDVVETWPIDMRGW